MTPKIFISYRREDSRHVARHIYDRLSLAFQKENIFFDVHKLLAGLDFRTGIDSAVDRSHVVVAVIGPKWLQLLREKEARGETDWVRHEIERGLVHGATVVPVLVDGATIPSESELPEQLKSLSYLNAITIYPDIHFDASLTLLTDELRKLGGASPRNESGFWDQTQGRKRGSLATVLMGLVLLCIFIVRELLPLAEVDPAELGHLLYKNCWVSYDPSQKTLDTNRQPVYPDIRTVEHDLDLIAAAGFSGVLTSSSDGIMAEVPRLAKSRKLKVMMGIWNAANRQEVSSAIRQSSFVDAYCVGSNGLLDRYSLRQLKQAVFHVKKRTGRPAAISEQANRYDEGLAAIGDWLFPDAHLTLKNDPTTLVANVDIDRDIQIFMSSTKHAAHLAKDAGRALIFKNIAYPHNGAKGANRTSQADFYRRIIEHLNDPQNGHSVKVSIIAQSAFDANWKTKHPFLAWDPFTGLLMVTPEILSELNSGRCPDPDTLLSPAGQMLLQQYPHLQPSIRVGQGIEQSE